MKTQLSGSGQKDTKIYTISYGNYFCHLRILGRTLRNDQNTLVRGLCHAHRPCPKLRMLKNDDFSFASENKTSKDTLRYLYIRYLGHGCIFDSKKKT
jgi:hypothetical protein